MEANKIVGNKKKFNCAALVVVGMKVGRAVSGWMSAQRLLLLLSSSLLSNRIWPFVSIL